MTETLPIPDQQELGFGWSVTEDEIVLDVPGWTTPPHILASAYLPITGSATATPRVIAEARITLTGTGQATVRTKADAILGADLPAARCQPAVLASAELAITGTGTTHVHLHDALPLPYALPFVLGGVSAIHPSPETNAPAVVSITAAFTCAVAAAARAWISYDTRATKAAVAVDAPAELPIEGSALTGHPTLLPFLLPAELPL